MVAAFRLNALRVERNLGEFSFLFGPERIEVFWLGCALAERVDSGGGTTVEKDESFQLFELLERTLAFGTCAVALEFGYGLSKLFAFRIDDYGIEAYESRFGDAGLVHELLRLTEPGELR